MPDELGYGSRQSGQPPPGSGWRDDYERYGNSYREPEDDNTILWTVVGCAVGVLLAMLPVRGLRLHRDQLIEIGAAVGALVGLACDLAEEQRRYGP